MVMTPQPNIGSLASLRILLIADSPSDAAVSQTFRFALGAWAKARGLELEEAIVDDFTVKPCVGCLACYRSTGGVCVHRDAFPKIRERARYSDCVVLLSEITYGQSSVAIKQVIDKGIGTPWGMCGPFPAQFEVGYGRNLTVEEISCFLDIVRRHSGKAEEIHRQLMGRAADACAIQKDDDIQSALERLERLLEEKIKPRKRSMGLHARRIPEEKVYESGNSIGPSAVKQPETDPHARFGTEKSLCLINGSLRGRQSTSHFLLNTLEIQLGTAQQRVVREALSLTKVTSGLADLAANLSCYDTLVIALPLFCYCVPSGLLRLLVELGKRPHTGKQPVLFVIVYSGFPLPRASREALRVLHIFAAKNNWIWGGSLVAGGGMAFKYTENLPLLGHRLDAPFSILASAVRGEQDIPPDLSVQPPVPRVLTDFIRNSMDRTAARKAERLKRTAKASN